MDQMRDLIYVPSGVAASWAEAFDQGPVEPGTLTGADSYTEGFG